jgi:hypothetical protein
LVNFWSEEARKFHKKPEDITRSWKISQEAGRYHKKPEEARKSQNNPE